MVFKSTFNEVKPPSKFNDSLSAFFWHQLDVFATKTLIVDYQSQREWTGQVIKRTTRHIAQKLVAEHDIKAGDCCFMLHAHSDHTLLAAISALFAGASVSAGYEGDPAPEQAYLLGLCKPKIVFCSGSLRDRLVDIRAESGGELQYKICVMDEPHKDELSFLRDLMPNNDQDDRVTTNGHDSELQVSLPVPVDPDAPAFILVTSGSTGRPKPVSRSHRNSIYVCYSLDGAEQLWHMDENSVLAGHLQLDHGTGTFSLKMTFAKGLKLVVMNGYDFNTLLDAIDKYQITDVCLGSALLHNFISEPEVKNHPFASLRNFLAVGSPIPSFELVQEFMAKRKDCSIRQGFGMTEAGFMTVVEREQADKDTISVGPLMPNLWIKLVDRQTGEEITELEREGELLVKGPTVSPGYLGDRFKEQTKATFLADGFYKSNDICMLTKDQKLVIKGRFSEVLCLHDGWKVLPSEIESELLTHPAILEASVIGIPHPNLPTCHAPRAFVVPKQAWRGGRLTEDDVKSYVAERLSGPKRLDDGGVKILDELPKTSIGKVDKQALRKLDSQR